jgi:hypothetical protein
MKDGDNLFPECHDQVALLSFFRLALMAQRLLCAAAIFALLFADIFRRLRLGPPPPYTFANAVNAAFNP